MKKSLSKKPKLKRSKLKKAKPKPHVRPATKSAAQLDREIAEALGPPRKSRLDREIEEALQIPSEGQLAREVVGALARQMMTLFKLRQRAARYPVIHDRVTNVMRSMVDAMHAATLVAKF